jgi:dnd system-associated protein 4
MASIRIPKELKPLLPLCRSFTGPRQDDNKNAAPFETFADLMVFAAAAGFHHLHGAAPNKKAKDFLDQPNPIDFSIFKSDTRHPVLLLIALATSKDKDIVRDEEMICRLTEDFAKAGAAIQPDILILADRLTRAASTDGSPRL